MNKRTKKLEKGITLIALIITIIVLLILAGVSIATLTGENGLLNKAVTAKEATERAELIEQMQLEILGKQAGGSGDISETELKAILEKYGTVNYEEGVVKSITTDKGNYEIEIGEICSGTTIEKTVLEYATGAKPTNTATIKEADETKGIVMVDDNDNEWVWIEVPKEVFATATSATDYDAIKADLIAYAIDYRNGNVSQKYSWSDEWYALDGETLVTASTEGLTDTQKALNNGCGLTYDEYDTAYQKMLNSVYTNKGFYISRYEIGDKESTASNITRTSSTGVTNTPVSKVDQIPYNYVTCSQAQTLASSMSTGDNKTSSLMFGIQWDLVCKYLEESGTAKADINSDSTSWGNYKNSSLTLKSGKYNTSPSSSTSLWTAFNIDTENYVTSSQTSSSISYYQLLTTGASEQTNKMNIYDFAGNEYEWTLEKTTDTSNPCAVRGGCYSDIGYYNPASIRGNGSTTNSGSLVGFRASLY